MNIIRGHVFPGLLLTIAVSLSSCDLLDTPESEQNQDLPMPSLTTTQVSPTPEPDLEFPVLGVAPELTNEVWLNADTPLRLAELKGKVVLIDFWTFG